jgi:hypothetical protein
MRTLLVATELQLLHATWLQVKRNMKKLTLGLIVCFLAVAGCHVQEPPYFVTYSHDLEEPGNLEARE